LKMAVAANFFVVAERSRKKKLFPVGEYTIDTQNAHKHAPLPIPEAAREL